MAEEGLLSQLKQLVVGKPIPSHLAHHERLSRFTGLAVLSSDPLSSVAYATEEILRVLILASVGVWLLCRQPYPARRVVLAAGLGVLLWTGRGLVLSGCAVYPLPQTCVHSFPWTIAPPVSAL